MEPTYNFPQDDYALALLSQAAMHNSSYAPTSALTASISNQQREDRRADLNGTKPPPSAISNDCKPSAVQSNRMETLTFNADNSISHSNYMDSAFRGMGSEISRNYANNLGILNAEIYDADGLLSRGSESKKTTDPAVIFGYEPDVEFREDVAEPEVSSRRRKKPPVDVHSADDDEESGKKSRGRPRVDTKDETAADRRRTQIRMAQRAYRHRKETTISSLEKQVQDLRGANEEMSNIFISLYDFAVVKGLLQREPEFGQQLQATTERFLALAKEGPEDLNLDDNHSEGTEKNERPVEEEAGPKRKRSRKSPPKGNATQEKPPPSLPAPVSLPWSGFPIGGQTEKVQGIEEDYQSQMFGHGSGTQIITRPTEENASFPFEFMDLQQYQVEVPWMDDFMQFLPQSQLPLPRSFSATESSFARRLHRGALEGALRLLTSENVPKSIMQRIFGFSGSYERKENGIARLKRILGSTAKESIQNWSAPFVHVGGSGTFYPAPDDDGYEDLMPKIRPGYSMGPFLPGVAQLEEVMQDDMSCKLPGFEGEFFDSNDVEGYLRHRGLNIPPSADIITAQIDLSKLSEVGSLRSQSSGSASTMPSPVSVVTPESSAEDLLADPVNFEYSLDPNNLDRDAYPFPLTLADWNSKNKNNIDSSFFTIIDHENTRASPIRREDSSEDKPIITLNVQTLLSELIRRGVCLGRAPGFRPSDVNAAIIAAIRPGNES